MSDEQAYANTDRELWREGGGDGNGMSYYEPSIHVTAQGGIGINVGGTVVVKTLREWMELALPSCPECGSRHGHIHWCSQASEASAPLAALTKEPDGSAPETREETEA